MISVYLVVKNEQANMRRVLESVKDFEEIVVVDSGSNDDTMQIAAEYTDRLFYHEWQSMARQKQFALDQCCNEWVLNLDADEELTSELKDQLVNIVSHQGFNGANIPIQEHFIGRAIHSATKKNKHIRFFRRQFGQYGTERFHETPTVTGPICELNGCIKHYGETSIEVKVDKINRYSTGKALDKFDKGKTSSFLKLLFIMPLTFLKSYLFRRNFLNGRIGFISSVVNAFYAFLKEAKLYQQEIIEEKKH